MLTTSKGQFRPVLIEHVELSVDIILHQQQDFLGHLLAVAVDQFDAVIVVRIVAGRDHDAAVKVIYASDVRHRRSGSNVQQIGICARSSQTSNQTVLKHVRAAASVFANDNASRVGITIALTQCIVVPAKEATYFIGMICC